MNKIILFVLIGLYACPVIAKPLSCNKAQDIAFKVMSIRNDGVDAKVLLKVAANNSYFKMVIYDAYEKPKGYSAIKFSKLHYQACQIMNKRQGDK